MAPEPTLRIIKDILRETAYTIHTGHGATKLITLLTGLKQGDPSAPVLFILFIKVLIRAFKKFGKGYTFKYPFKSDITNPTCWPSATTSSTPQITWMILN